MNAKVIEFDDVGKQYILGSIGTGTISQDLNRWWAKMRGKEDPFLKIGVVNDRTHSGGDVVWALKDVSFDVEQGDVVGIIGKNGAGKSTLLKILSRVTSPTVGSIKVKGRIASLLEVGTGFHPEMTGRENIFMNGSIMGMTKAEIKSKFDEIVDFAGVEKYVDTPVKRYSSGMIVRLGFAIAAHLEPEILVVDEVLAVGDAEFQKKAIGKMQDVSKGEGRTVLFVSHNMSAVRSLCTKGILLQNGTIKYTGQMDDVINKYLSDGGNNDSEFIINRVKFAKSYLHINKIMINNSESSQSTITSTQKYLEVLIDGHTDESFEYDTMLIFKSKEGLPLMTFAYGHYKGIIKHMPKGYFQIYHKIELPEILSKGYINVDLFLHHPMVEAILEMPNCCTLQSLGFQEGYGRALRQENEGIIGLTEIQT